MRWPCADGGEIQKGASVQNYDQSDITRTILINHVRSVYSYQIHLAP